MDDGLVPVERDHRIRESMWNVTHEGAADRGAVRVSCHVAMCRYPATMSAFLDLRLTWRSVRASSLGAGSILPSVPAARRDVYIAYMTRWYLWPSTVRRLADGDYWGSAVIPELAAISSLAQPR